MIKFPGLSPHTVTQMSRMQFSLQSLYIVQLSLLQNCSNVYGYLIGHQSQQHCSQSRPPPRMVLCHALWLFGIRIPLFLFVMTAIGLNASVTEGGSLVLPLPSLLCHAPWLSYSQLAQSSCLSNLDPRPLYQGIKWIPFSVRSLLHFFFVVTASDRESSSLVKEVVSTQILLLTDSTHTLVPLIFRSLGVANSSSLRGQWVQEHLSCITAITTLQFFGYVEDDMLGWLFGHALFSLKVQQLMQRYNKQIQL